MTATIYSQTIMPMLRPGAPWRSHAWAAAAVPVVVLLVFGSVLVAPGDIVLSDASTDTARQFLSWRSYGFGELGQGRFPFWNPYVYCGTAYFAGFQSALLYPVNWVHLVLPAPRAINVEILLNLTILGLGVYGWLMRSGRSPAACLCGATAAALGGGVAPHVYAGHLTNLAAMAWVPAVLLCIDGAWEARTALPPRRRRLMARWLAAGSAAVALQILAGHPQYVYYTGLCVGILLAFRAMAGGRAHPAAERAGDCLWASGIALGVYAGGCLLAAAQLVPGLVSASENLRAGRLPYHYAALFSVPPENLLTFIVPYAFGDLTTMAYWGRWYLWETCFFVGSAALPLAAWSLCSRERRGTGVPDAMAALLLTALACGAYTPLFPVLYALAPGFGSFRCTAKLMFFASLLVVRFAATGFDGLLREDGPGRGLARALGVLAAVCAGLALYAGLAAQSPASPAGTLWRHLLVAVQATGQTCLPGEAVDDPQWLAATADGAAASALRAASVLAGLAIVTRIRRRCPGLGLALPALAVLDMVLFASNFRVTFSVQDLGLTELRSATAGLEPGERVLYLPSHNLPMLAGVPDIWGNDPSLSRRYARFMATAQGHGPAEVTQDMPVDQPHPLLRLTGCRLAFVPRLAGPRVTALSPPPLPRLRLVGAWDVLTSQSAALSRLADPGFDLTRRVILESDPGLTPADAPVDGTIEVVEEDSDHLRLRVTCERDVVLLLAQAYSRYWTAEPAQHTDTRTYRLLPANYAFQGVPLQAGHHDLLVVYRAPGLTLGMLLSIGGTIAIAGTLAWTRGTAVQQDLAGGTSAHPAA